MKKTLIKAMSVALMAATLIPTTAMAAVQPAASTTSIGSVATIKGVTGSQVVTEANKYIGTPYVYGGTTTSGFDCSGFTQYVFKQLGVSISRTTKTQVKDGTAVSKSNLAKGDLVFFQNTYSGCTNPSHVGIYIGDNKFIHCGSSGVTTADITSSYWSGKYYSARRVI